MILRRVKAHIENENWFAVFIDFFIVVVGVFIGIQVANWNADRMAKLDFEAAVDRYRAEIRTNIAELETIIQQTEDRSETVRRGFDALLTCEDSEENRRAVEAALSPASGTIGISVALTALDELTSSPTLLAQQSEAQRQLFSETRNEIGLILREADFNERLPFDSRLVDSPVVGIGDRVEKVPDTGDYAFHAYTDGRRTMVLRVPVDVACKDEKLVKSIYVWEQWQPAIPAHARQMMAIYKANLEAIQP